MADAFLGGTLRLLTGTGHICFDPVIIHLIWVDHRLENVLVQALRLLNGLLQTLDVMWQRVLFRSLDSLILILRFLSDVMLFLLKDQLVLLA